MFIDVLHHLLNMKTNHNTRGRLSQFKIVAPSLFFLFAKCKICSANSLIKRFKARLAYYKILFLSFYKQKTKKTFSLHILPLVIHLCYYQYDYRTQVNLGSDSWVQMSVRKSVRDIVETLLM